MLKIILFVIGVIFISLGLTWLIDNNGLIHISWLGYQIDTDILTALVSLFFVIVALFIFTHIFTSILTFKFRIPQFLKRDVLKQKDKIIKKYQKAVKLLVETSLALNSADLKGAIRLEKKISSLIEDEKLKKLLTAQIIYLKGDYQKAAELFAQFENDNAQILSLKSQLELYLDKNNQQKATEFAEKIMAKDKDNKETALILFSLYKKQGNWSGASRLINKYNLHIDNKKDSILINTALAHQLYIKKDYKKSIKYAQAALNSDKNFLAALIILTKSYVKKGAKLRAVLKIKSIWKRRPNILLAEIYNFIYKKSSNKKRLKMVKKLHKINPNHFLSDIAVGNLALTLKDFDETRNYLKMSLLKRKTSKAYRLTALLEKLENQDEEKEKRYISKAKLEEFSQHWFCSECRRKTVNWHLICQNCSSYNSLVWKE